jgi:hypothetical protein
LTASSRTSAVAARRGDGDFDPVSAAGVSVSGTRIVDPDRFGRLARLDIVTPGFTQPHGVLPAARRPRLDAEQLAARRAHPLGNALRRPLKGAGTTGA